MQTCEMTEKITIIERLVKSLQEHRNFRQLSCYSLECIVKYLNPLHPEADDFLDKAIDCNAVEVILDIISNHSVHEDVLGRCADCLCRLATNPKMASKIYDQLKQFNFLYDVMEEGGDRISESTAIQVISLISMISAHPHISSQAEDDSLMRLLTFMETQIHIPEVICLSVVLFEHISEGSPLKYPALVDNQAPRILLFLFDTYTNDIVHHDCVNRIIMCTTRILLRLSEDSNEVIFAINKLKGDEKYLRVLTEEKDFGISRLGGRLLSRLIGKRDILSFVPVINEEKNESDEMKKNLQLFHAAAAYDDGCFVQEITEKHINDILQAFAQRQNNQVLILLSKIISMLAAHPRAADFLIRCGLVTIFYRRLLNEQTPVDAVTHTLNAFLSVVNSTTLDCTDIIREIGIAVLESLRRHTNVISTTSSALALLAAAEDKRDEMDLLSSQYEDYPCIVICSMRQHLHKINIQLSGSCVLLKLLQLQRFDDTLTESVVSDLLELVSLNLCNHSSDRSLLVVSLKHILLLLTGDSYSILQDKSDIIWDALISSADVIFQHHNALCIARSIMNIMSSEDTVKTGLQNLSQNIHGKCHNLVESEINTRFLNRLQIMVMSKQNNEILIRNNAFSKLVDVFQSTLIKQNGHGLMLSVISAINSIIERSPKARRHIKFSTLCQLALQVLDNAPKYSSEELSQCLLLVKYSLLYDKECPFEGVDIAKISGIFGMHVNNEDIVSSCLDVLQILALGGLHRNIASHGIVIPIMLLTKQLMHSRVTMAKSLQLLEEILKDDSCLKMCLTSNRYILDDFIRIHDECKDPSMTSSYGAIIQALASEDEVERVKEKLVSIKPIPTNSEELENTIKKARALIFCNKLCDNELILIAIDLIQGSWSQKCNKMSHSSLLSFSVEVICSSDTASDTLQRAVLIIWPLLLQSIQVSPTVDTCKSMSKMLENTIIEDILEQYCKLDIMSHIFSLVQKGRVDSRFFVYAFKALRYFVHRSSDMEDLIEDYNIINHICNFIMSTLDKESHDGLPEAITVLILVGKRNPILLIRDCIYGSIFEVLSSKNISTSFPVTARLISIIAATGRGREGIKTHGLSPLLVKAFSRLYDQGKNCIRATQSMTIAVGAMVKSKHILAVLQGIGFHDILISILNYHSCDEAIGIAVAKCIQYTQTGQQLNTLTSLHSDIISIAKKMKRKAVRSKKVTALLGQYYEALASADEKRISEIDVIVSMKYLKIILTNVKSCYQENSSEEGEIRFLSLMVLNRILRSINNDIYCDTYFVKECLDMATDSASRHRACAFACIGTLIKFRKGIYCVTRKEVLYCIKSTVPPFAWESGYNANLGDDVMYALKAMAMISEKICDYASLLVKSKEGIEAIATFICQSHKRYRETILQIISEEVGGPIDTLFLLLASVIKEGLAAVCTIQCIVKRIFKIEATDFTMDQVAIIVSSCRLYPGGVILLRKLSSTAHGKEMILKVKDTIDVVIHILIGNMQFVGCATSILADCILTSNDFSFLVSKHMKDANVAVVLLDMLESLVDDEIITSIDIVKNSLSIISTLLSVFDSDSLNLGHQYVDCMTALSRKMEDSECFKVIQDIILKLTDVIDENDLTVEHPKRLEVPLSEEDIVDKDSLISLVIAELETCMSSHLCVQAGLERVITLLSTVTVDDIRISSVLPKLVADVSVSVSNNYDKRNIILLCMKIFCILSISDEYLSFMVNSDLLTSLVPMMVKQKADSSLTGLSIKLISNYGACRINEDLVQLHIKKTGCHEFIVQSIDCHITDSDIIGLAMECLYNTNCATILADAEDLNYHDHGGFLSRIFSLLNSFHYDLDITAQCLKVASCFTVNSSSICDFTTLGGIQIITQVLLLHVQHGGEIVERITLCLANIALTDEGRNALIVGGGVVKLLEDCLTFNPKNERVCKHVLYTLSTLVNETSLCRDISHHGLYMLRNAVIFHIDDTAMLSFFLEIICQMSRNKEQISGIIQSGCIPVLFRVIKEISPQQQMMAQVALLILWNLMVYSDESWWIIVSSGLEAVVEGSLCKLSHPEVQTMAQKMMTAINSRGGRCQSKSPCVIPKRRKTLRGRLVSITNFKV